jgi:protein-S-isoprenylcysteine O-methyltransferase Ste14
VLSLIVSSYNKGELIIFWLGSIGFIILSRKALLNPRSHGFPRFFAFEALLGLVVINAPYWFNQPFSIPQLISWLLLLISGFLVIYSVWILRQFGAPDKSVQDANRLTFEKTTHLVTSGPYHYIRHPMYASLLYLTWGVFLKHISLFSVLLTIIASLALFLTAVNEERENLDIFGDEYAVYMKDTKRFIPYMF